MAPRAFAHGVNADPMKEQSLRPSDILANYSKEKINFEATNLRTAPRFVGYPWAGVAVVLIRRNIRGGDFV